MRHAGALGQDLSHAGERFRELGVDLREIEGLCAGPGNEEDIDARRQPIPSTPETLAAKALDAVSHHGVAGFTGNHEPEAGRSWRLARPRHRRGVFFPRREHHDEMSHSDPAPLFEGAVELGSLAYASVSSERCGAPIRGGHFL